MLVKYAQRTINQENYQQSRVFQMLVALVCEFSRRPLEFIHNILCFFIDFLNKFDVSDEDLLVKIF